MAGNLCTPLASEYDVAWISPTSKDLLIASAVLDERFECPADLAENDSGTYTFGRIGGHNVVIATPPKGRVGVEQASALVENVTRSFKRLRFGLIVGTAGGAPTQENDIRLGDIVVSTPNDSKRLGGVFQYSFGASVQGKGFQYRGSLNAPPEILLNAVGLLEFEHSEKPMNYDKIINELVEAHGPRYTGYQRPDPSSDILFNSTFVHLTEETGDCRKTCIKENEAATTATTATTTTTTTTTTVVHRNPRQDSSSPTLVHHGIIASASTLVRNAILRDTMAAENGVLCFEMESSAIMNNRIGWLAVRGISNYADTHKNDLWQKYAAAVAALYAKDLLGVIRPRARERERAASERADDDHHHLAVKLGGKIHAIEDSSGSGSGSGSGSSGSKNGRFHNFENLYIWSSRNQR